MCKIISSKFYFYIFIKYCSERVLRERPWFSNHSKVIYATNLISPLRMKVLISPKDEFEATEAVNGGADIIDVKNPIEGSLGANFSLGYPTDSEPRPALDRSERNDR